MRAPLLHTRRQALLRCLYVALTALVCAGLMGAAALIPAPPAVLPFVVLVCIGFPMAAACELPDSIAALRARARALDTMRRHLDELPEVEHPLGL